MRVLTDHDWGKKNNQNTNDLKVNEVIFSIFFLPELRKRTAPFLNLEQPLMDYPGLWPNQHTCHKLRLRLSNLYESKLRPRVTWGQRKRVFRCPSSSWIVTMCVSTLMRRSHLKGFLGFWCRCVFWKVNTKVDLTFKRESKFSHIVLKQSILWIHAFLRETHKTWMIISFSYFFV